MHELRDAAALMRDEGAPGLRVQSEGDSLFLVQFIHLDELEEEERAAQSAKLQELIRRGAPEDLQEANRLMKIMAGYDTRHRTDYRAKAAEEVSKIQQKAKILEEMLQGYTKEDKIAEGDLPEVGQTSYNPTISTIVVWLTSQTGTCQCVAKRAT